MANWFRFLHRWWLRRSAVRIIVLIGVAIPLLAMALRLETMLANVSATRGAAIVAAFGVLEVALISFVIHILRRFSL